MGKIWTNDEIKYLKENVGYVLVETMAEYLGRTETAVIIKMKRLGLANTKEQLGLLTIGSLATLLGVDRNTVENWTVNYQLPCKKRKCRNTRTFYFIYPEDFWIWAYKNTDRIDFSKIARHSIPPEPDWVESFRRRKVTPIGNYYRSWTYKEEQQLLKLRRMGLSFEAIGEKLGGRTSISVDRKYGRLTNRQSFSNTYERVR